MEVGLVFQITDFFLSSSCRFQILANISVFVIIINAFEMF